MWIEATTLGDLVHRTAEWRSDHEALVFPDVDTATPVDLRQHYFDHARWFFGFAMALLAVVGGCLGAGALLVLDEPVNALNWAATLLLCALFLPVHVWVAFGPPRAGARS